MNRPERLLALAGFRRIIVREHERGILWQDETPKELLTATSRWTFDPLAHTRVDVHDRRAPWLPDANLDLLVRANLLKNEAETLDLSDTQRALAWVDNRFAGILGPGLHAWWKGMADVKIETIDIRDHDNALVRPDLPVILAHSGSDSFLDAVHVPIGNIGALYHDGVFKRTLPPGRYAFWSGDADNAVTPLDAREQTLDIPGQELLTADKLPVRLNVALSCRIADAQKFLSAASDPRQSLYREAQLALRAAVGARDLDALMADKETLAKEMETAVRPKAAAYGYDIASFGIRDVILPGEVRELLLKTVAAKKNSEAATIARREETAALRHQLNSARLLADNPALMRLRELETIEKVAAGGKLTVVTGEKGLVEKVTGVL